MTAIDFIEDESLIPAENSIITLTNKGYIKRIKAYMVLLGFIIYLV
jgi:DNA gyrase/topoisomerase IV subunit A